LRAGRCVICTVHAMMAHLGSRTHERPHRSVQMYLCSRHRRAARPKPRSNGQRMGLLLSSNAPPPWQCRCRRAIAWGSSSHARANPTPQHAASRLGRDNMASRERSRSQMQAHLLALSHRAPDVLDVGFCDRRDRIVHQVEVLQRRVPLQRIPEGDPSPVAQRVRL